MESRERRGRKDQEKGGWGEARKGGRMKRVRRRGGKANMVGGGEWQRGRERDDEAKDKIGRWKAREDDGYYVTYIAITLLCISFIFIKIKFIYSCVIFIMKSMNICNN